MSNDLLDPAKIKDDVERINRVVQKHRLDSAATTKKCDAYRSDLLIIMSKLAHDEPEAFKIHFQKEEPDYRFDLDSHGRHIVGWKMVFFAYENDPDAKQYIQNYTSRHYNECIRRSP